MRQQQGLLHQESVGQRRCTLLETGLQMGENGRGSRVGSRCGRRFREQMPQPYAGAGAGAGVGKDGTLLRSRARVHSVQAGRLRAAQEGVRMPSC